MPQVIGGLILGAFGVSAPTTAGFAIGGVTITYASIVGTTVLIAAEIGLSLLLAPSISKPDGQFAITQPVPWRRRVYGKPRIGGAFLFEGDADDRD